MSAGRRESPRKAVLRNRSSDMSQSQQMDEDMSMTGRVGASQLSESSFLSESDTPVNTPQKKEMKTPGGTNFQFDPNTTNDSVHGATRTFSPNYSGSKNWEGEQDSELLVDDLDASKTMEFTADFGNIRDANQMGGMDASQTMEFTAVYGQRGEENFEDDTKRTGEYSRDHEEEDEGEEEEEDVTAMSLTQAVGGGGGDTSRSRLTRSGARRSLGERSPSKTAPVRASSRKAAKGSPKSAQAASRHVGGRRVRGEADAPASPLSKTQPIHRPRRSKRARSPVATQSPSRTPTKTLTPAKTYSPRTPSRLRRSEAVDSDVTMNTTGGRTGTIASSMEVSVADEPTPRTRAARSLRRRGREEQQHRRELSTTLGATADDSLSTPSQAGTSLPSPELPARPASERRATSRKRGRGARLAEEQQRPQSAKIRRVRRKQKQRETESPTAAILSRRTGRRIPKIAFDEFLALTTVDFSNPPPLDGEETDAAQDEESAAPRGPRRSLADAELTERVGALLSLAPLRDTFSWASDQLEQMLGKFEEMTDLQINEANRHNSALMRDATRVILKTGADALPEDTVESYAVLHHNCALKARLTWYKWRLKISKAIISHMQQTKAGLEGDGGDLLTPGLQQIEEVKQRLGELSSKAETLQPKPIQRNLLPYVETIRANRTRIYLQREELAGVAERLEVADAEVASGREALRELQSTIAKYSEAQLRTRKFLTGEKKQEDEEEEEKEVSEGDALPTLRKARVDYANTCKVLAWTLGRADRRRITADLPLGFQLEVALHSRAAAAAGGKRPARRKSRGAAAPDMGPDVVSSSLLLPGEESIFSLLAKQVDLQGVGKSDSQPASKLPLLLHAVANETMRLEMIRRLLFEAKKAHPIDLVCDMRRALISEGADVTTRLRTKGFARDATTVYVVFTVSNMKIGSRFKVFLPLIDETRSLERWVAPRGVQEARPDSLNLSFLPQPVLQPQFNSPSGSAVLKALIKVEMDYERGVVDNLFSGIASALGEISE